MDKSNSKNTTKSNMQTKFISKQVAKPNGKTESDKLAKAVFLYKSFGKHGIHK